MNPSPIDHPTLRRALLAWYDANARDLPWRGVRDPYAIWVSEVMSQQTRIETVRAYYERWMVAFPSVAALADAAEDDVMAQWAGLGYYRRARGLHEAARQIVERHGGAVPETSEALRELPGVGDYTSAAVASIAFGEAVPAIDGNVTRVASRLRVIGGEPHRAAFRRAVREVAETLVDPARPGDSNQAMMELGATVCTPRNPDCERCPIAQGCRARLAGVIEQYPPPARRPAPRPESRSAVVMWDGDEVLIRRRDGSGLLAGTWEFPTVDEDADVSAVASRYLDVAHLRRVSEVEHVFSHIRMTYRVHVASGRRLASNGEESAKWIGATRLDDVALSVAMRKVFAVARDDG